MEGIKMIKKNQLALVFLTVVVMLAIWYIKSPINANDKNKDDDNTEETGSNINQRLEELIQMREAVHQERDRAVLGYDAIIADGESSINEIKAALEEKRYLAELSEKEVLLELQVINKGYDDAFVHATNTGIEIIVVSTEDDPLKTLEIINMALSSFGDGYENVVVTVTTADQLKA
jgi:hypothetical protein